MTFRRIVIVLFILGGFWYLTTLSFSPLHRALVSGHNLASDLSLTEAHAAPEYTSQEQNNIAVYKRALPSVVNITSSALTYNFFFQIVPQQDQGSGFILDKQGHILTNNHVIAGGQQIEVTLSNKQRYRATLVGHDPSQDLALLKIEAPPSDLVPATLAASGRNLVVGQLVYAIGNPFGLSGTMTTGIISAIRTIREPEGQLIENAIQTDAAINPGNSGGPLLNSHGEVIGINTLIATNPNSAVEQSAGIGFSIPIDTAKAVLGDFQKYGHVRRPSLGIESISVNPDLAHQMGLPTTYGVLVQRVFPGGAAAQAGLRGGNQTAYLGNMQIYLGGDFIVGLDGQQVTDTQDINNIMNQHQVGDTIAITYFRGGHRITTKVTLGEAHERAA
jgi:S1-C subfamily serine protease